MLRLVHVWRAGAGTLFLMIDIFVYSALRIHVFCVCLFSSFVCLGKAADVAYPKRQLKKQTNFLLQHFIRFIISSICISLNQNLQISVSFS